MFVFPAGYQADVRFKETKEYLRPLFSRLKNGTLDTQMLAGLKLIVEAMKGRNYLHAYKVRISFILLANIFIYI